MRQAIKKLGFELDTESGWRVSFDTESTSEDVRIGLMWGKKDYPTHEVFVSKVDLIKLVKELCEG